MKQKESSNGDCNKLKGLNMAMEEAHDQDYLRAQVIRLKAENAVLKEALKNRDKTIKDRENYVRDLKRNWINRC